MKRLLFLFISIISIVAFHSCDDRDDIRSDIDSLNSRLDALESLVEQYNTDIANYRAILNGAVLVTGYTCSDNGDYIIELSNGDTISVYSGEPDESLPVMSIGEDGYWYYTQYDVTYPLRDDNGDMVSASPEAGVTPQFRVNSDGEWEYTLDGTTWIGDIGMANPELAQAGTSLFDDVVVDDDGKYITLTWTSGSTQLSKTVAIYEGLSLEIDYGNSTPVTFGLGQTKVFSVTQSDDIVEAVIETTGWSVKLTETTLTVTAPTVNLRGVEYDDQIAIKIFSQEGYCRLVTLPVRLLTTTIDENSATAWQNFLSGGDDNVLLDFSYAGYMRGETAPSDGFAWGYTVVNVQEYMDMNSMSAREALEDILDSYNLIRKSNSSATNSSARVVIYFPEGEYILQEEGSHDKPYPIYGGNFVIKGDGPDKTRLVMADYIGTDESSTGALISIGHTNSPRNISNSQSLAHVTANASKGDFSVQVSSTSGISAGDWVQLRLRSADDDLLQEELGPLYSYRSGWSIAQTPGLSSESAEDGNGIFIMEFHQVKSASGGTVTFYEPIMSDIDVSINDYNDGWEIRQYKCFENVGIEDIAFVGGESLLTPYYHHGEGVDETLAWLYDYGYEPVVFNRLVNSWIRNVTFNGVSEAVTFNQCANCSAYDIQIEGKRGHSAVRAQESSRVFIGGVRDESEDEVAHGQYHGCGVSKPSIGTVVWNCTWGIDACFESHATQPRATLFDNCSGGLVYYHAGGAETEAPNHLRDLTIWNLYVTGTTDEKGRSFASDFHWWLQNDKWWKIYPPIVVGTYGVVSSGFFTVEENQLSYEESTGTKVTPESLYEAQLEYRLGYVPAWLNALK